MTGATPGEIGYLVVGFSNPTQVRAGFDRLADLSGFDRPADLSAGGPMKVLDVEFIHSIHGVASTVPAGRVDHALRTLETLAPDETMLVQSGKPVGVWQTHEWAPRVLLANSNLVGDWATWPEFRRLEHLGWLHLKLLLARDQLLRSEAENPAHAVEQSPHVREAVGRLRVVAAHHPRAVIKDHDAIELDVVQGFHDLLHVVVSIIHERLHEARQGRADVAEVDLPDLPGAEVSDHLLRVLARESAAPLEPGPAAQADPDVRAVGDLQGAPVALEVAEDAARDAGQHRHRRVVGVDADPDSGLFRDGGHLLDEMGVVVPDLFFREDAAVRERLLPGLAAPEPLPVRARQVELPAVGSPGLRATAAPDPIAHVSVRRVADARLPEVAKILLVFLDLAVTPGEVQRDLGHVVDVAIADVPDGDPRVRKTFLDLHESFGGSHVARRPDADVFGADLVEEEQLLIRWCGRRLRAELDPGPPRGIGDRFLGGQASEGHGADGAGEGHLAEVPAVGIERHTNRLTLRLAGAHRSCSSPGSSGQRCDDLTPLVPATGYTNASSSSTESRPGTPPHPA